MKLSSRRWGQPRDHWLRVALAFFYPEACQLCGRERASPAEGYVCARCRGKVRLIQPPFCQRCGLPFAGELTTPFECSNCREMDLRFVSARSAVVAGGVVLEAIHRFKYQRALWLEPFLADLLIREAGPALAGGRWDCLVPVPLHPTKYREREFNQAARLASALGRALRIPVRPEVLRRILPTQTQTRLTRQARADNVRHAFALRPGHRLRGERVVLIDDVFTTGATTSACARILRAGGAGDVCVWTVARGI
jgi:competence protein ComFC